MPKLPTYDVQAIAERVMHTREAYDSSLSASAFARLIGVSPQVLNNCEHGRNRPSVELAYRIASATGVTMDWIFFGRRDGISAKMAAALAEREAAREKAG